MARAARGTVLMAFRPPASCSSTGAAAVHLVVSALPAAANGGQLDAQCLARRISGAPQRLTMRGAADLGGIGGGS